MIYIPKAPQVHTMRGFCCIPENVVAGRTFPAYYKWIASPKTTSMASFTLSLIVGCG